MLPAEGAVGQRAASAQAAKGALSLDERLGHDLGHSDGDGEDAGDASCEEEAIARRTGARALTDALRWGHGGQSLSRFSYNGQAPTLEASSTRVSWASLSTVDVGSLSPLQAVTYKLPTRMYDMGLGRKTQPPQPVGSSGLGLMAHGFSAGHGASGRSSGCSSGSDTALSASPTAAGDLFGMVQPESQGGIRLQTFNFGSLVHPTPHAAVRERSRYKR
ncbi:hypothetical protein T492DRAFT_116725 [Pavlovales sp. CCMP2436]|nr:hypothetical protein T492DRAFT_116725 [Pavlovales sp. CCMP2436]